MSYNLENFLEDFKRDLKPCSWYGYNCSIKKKFIKLLQEHKNELWNKEYSNNFNVTNTNPGGRTVNKHGIDKIDFTRQIILYDNYCDIIFLTDENQQYYDMRNKFFQSTKTLIVLGNISTLTKPMDLNNFNKMIDLQIILPNLKSTGSYICENSANLIQVEFCVPSLINLGDIFSYSFLNNCPRLTFCIFDAPKLVFRDDIISSILKKNLIYFSHNFITLTGNCVNYDNYFNIESDNNIQETQLDIKFSKKNEKYCNYFNEKYANIKIEGPRLGISAKNIKIIQYVQDKYCNRIGIKNKKEEEEKKEEEKKIAALLIKPLDKRRPVDPKNIEFFINHASGSYPNSIEEEEKGINGGKKSSTKKGMAGKKIKKKSSIKKARKEGKKSSIKKGRKSINKSKKKSSKK